MREVIYKFTGNRLPPPLRGSPSTNSGRAKLLSIFEDVLFTVKWYTMIIFLL